MTAPASPANVTLTELERDLYYRVMHDLHDAQQLVYGVVTTILKAHGLPEGQKGDFHVVDDGTLEFHPDPPADGTRLRLVTDKNT